MSKPQQFRLKSFHHLDEDVFGVLREADPKAVSVPFIADKLNVEPASVRESLVRLQCDDRVREATS